MGSGLRVCGASPNEPAHFAARPPGGRLRRRAKCAKELHAAIRREKRDGRVTIKPFSLWMLVVCGLVFFFAGFFSARQGADFTTTNVDRGNPPPAQSTLQAVQTSTASASAVQSTVADANAPVVAHVAMKNMKFDPPLLEVKKGDTVEWKIRISRRTRPRRPHSIPARSLLTPPGATPSLGGGNFPYACTFHPEMKAAVAVK